jgi:hypothetical protein
VALGLIAGLASFAFQGASALLGASSQRAASKENARNALLAYRLNIGELGERAKQAEQASALETSQNQLHGLAAASTAAASAAESGVGGSSVSALLAKFASETSTAQAATGTSLDNTLSELTRRAEGAGVDYRARLSSVSPPSGLVTGLQIAGAGLNLLPFLGGGPRKKSPPKPKLGSSPNAVPGK